jgi:hypothetical protein
MAVTSLPPLRSVSTPWLGRIRKLSDWAARRHPAHLTVLKTRASLHEPQVRAFTITTEGINLGDDPLGDPASE